jgi:hypothetical protein
VHGLESAAREAGVPLVGDSEGGMFGFFFADGLPQNYAVVMATDKERFNRFFHGMLDRGVYLAPALYEAGFVSAAQPALVDVARLAQALDPEGATADHAVHRTRSRAAALGCMACGAPLGPEAAWQCDQCGATLAAPGLAQAHRQISALGPALEAHARKPAAHVVRQRLAAQDAALQRQRESAAQMQAEADAAAGRVPGGLQDGDDAFSSPLPIWVWVGALALAIWWWWW